MVFSILYLLCHKKEVCNTKSQGNTYNCQFQYSQFEMIIVLLSLRKLKVFKFHSQTSSNASGYTVIYCSRMRFRLSFHLYYCARNFSFDIYSVANRYEQLQIHREVTNKASERAIGNKQLIIMHMREFLYIFSNSYIFLVIQRQILYMLIIILYITS